MKKLDWIYETYPWSLTIKYYMYVLTTENDNDTRDKVSVINLALFIVVNL